MIEKWLELLGGFIVEALCKKFGLNTAADLEAMLGRVAKSELPDLSKFETLPDQVIANVNAQIGGVVAQLTGIPAQVISLIKSWLPAIPGLPNIFGP